MNGITILSTGRYIPEDCIANEDFTKFVETSDEWIRTRTGIATRHFANGEPTWYMGAMAAKAALERESIAPEQIDLLLVSCCTPDYLTPSVACMIQRELGLKKAHCIDINCACSGFVYGLDMARRYLNCGDGEIQTVLLVSTERLSQMLDFTDRSTGRHSTPSIPGMKAPLEIPKPARSALSFPRCRRNSCIWTAGRCTASPPGCSRSCCAAAAASWGYRCRTWTTSSPIRPITVLWILP